MIKRYLKSKHTHGQTDRRTGRLTFRLIESIGPEGRCFENHCFPFPALLCSPGHSLVCSAVAHWLSRWLYSGQWTVDSGQFIEKNCKNLNQTNTFFLYLFYPLWLCSIMCQGCNSLEKWSWENLLPIKLTLKYTAQQNVHLHGLARYFFLFCKSLSTALWSLQIVGCVLHQEISRNFKGIWDATTP